MARCVEHDAALQSAGRWDRAGGGAAVVAAVSEDDDGDFTSLIAGDAAEIECVQSHVHWHFAHMNTCTC
jgi:hypothetical protein